MTQTTSYSLLTFYAFVDVEDPTEQVREHKEFCQHIGLKGRVYIGEEGISATVSGCKWQLWSYKQYLSQNTYFHSIPDIDIKASDVSGHCFSKMIVKYRKEIVALGKVYDAHTICSGGQKMTIAEFKRIMDTNDEDYVILDMRNTYEYKLGHFKGALPAGTINFRELDAYLDLYKQRFGGKKIVTYCTGGIRCEKATVMMREFGIDQVYQLDGGVMKYVNTYNDGNRLGNLYTFDARVSMKIGDSQTHTTIGKCIYTGRASNNCENCRYSPCNARIIASKKAYKQYLGFCSKECIEKAKNDALVKNSRFDPIDYKELRHRLDHEGLDQGSLHEKLSGHYAYWLGDRSFPHEKSQKEAYVDQHILEQVLD